MQWLMRKEKSLQEQRSMNSLEEKIQFYYTSLERDTKTIGNQQAKNFMDMKSHLFEELRELVERY